MISVNRMLSTAILAFCLVTTGEVTAQSSENTRSRMLILGEEVSVDYTAVRTRAVARSRTVRSNRSVKVKRTTVRNRNVNVNVNRNVVRRPVVAVRPWRTRPHYGTFIAGVALGTIVTAAPAAPAPNLCWYWTDSNMVQGYWDYCQ
jgi:hypothetical protein